jgi:DNA polymerase III gamma/tau subunit
VTSEPHRVIETIRSRCLRVRFGNLSEENVINVIFQKLGFDATQSRILGWIASGSSIDIFPQAGMFLKQRDRAMGFVHRATRGNLIDLLDFIEELDKEEMGAFIDMLVLLMSDLLLLLNNVDQIVNSDLRKQLTEEMGRFNPKGLLAAVNTLSQVKRYDYLNINLNNSLRNALIKVQPYFKAA